MVLHEWGELIAWCLKLRDSPKIWTVSDEVRSVYSAFNNVSVELQRGPFRDCQPIMKRWKEKAIRIACTLCAIAHYRGMADPGRDTEIAHAAVRIARYYALSSLSSLQPARHKALEARKIKLVELLTPRNGFLLKSVLGNSHGFEWDEVLRLVEEFPGALKVEHVQHGKGGGRPGVGVKLMQNPKRSVGS